MADEKRDERSWFLRIATGTIFGPVSTQGLIAWAEQGRIRAGNEVSTDRKEWIAAEEVPELGISWYLEDAAGGLVGPFHQRAAEKLLQEKRAPEGARLVAAAEADLTRLRHPAESRAASRDDGHPELALGEATPAAGGTDLRQLQEERESLRLRIAELEAQTHTLLKTAEREGRSQTRQLEAARKDVEKLKKHIAELVGQMAEDAANNEMVEQLQRQNEELDTALRQARSSYAELLDFSNGRDREHATAVAELEQQLATQQAELESLRQAASEQGSPDHIREMHTRLKEQEMLLAGVLNDDAAVVAQLLAHEREAFAVWRDASLLRQGTLQERLTAIQKLQGGETGDAFEREARARSEKAHTAKLQDSLDLLRSEHARYARQAEARERELVTRVRTLELEEEHLKERAAEAELLIQRNQQLSEQLQDREQLLAQERQQRSIEQAQLEAAHNALMEQLDEVKSREDSLLPQNLPLGDVAGPDNGKVPPRAAFRVTPWMQLKR